MGLFLASHLKLKRARRHIDELKALIDPYLASEPVKVWNQKVEVVNGKQSISATTRTEPPPEETATILGDIVHNLRSSLDLMASELGEVRSGKAGLAQFPFARTEDDLSLQIKNKSFYLCGEEAESLLRTLRPYHNGNTELRAVHDLDIVDKHKGLFPVPNAQFTLFDVDLVSQPGQALPTFPTVKDLGVQLLMPVGSGLEGRELFPTLEELVKLCEGILEAFAALYPADEAGGQGR